jgi:hypothetical protein
MSRYRRLKIEGGAFFYTLALADRGSDLLGRVLINSAQCPLSSESDQIAASHQVTLSANCGQLVGVNTPRLARRLLLLTYTIGRSGDLGVCAANVSYKRQSKITERLRAIKNNQAVSNNFDGFVIHWDGNDFSASRVHPTQRLSNTIQGQSTAQKSSYRFRRRSSGLQSQLRSVHERL